MPDLLLDTCAVVWMAQGEKLSDTAIARLAEAANGQRPTYVSAITAWEIGLLVSKQRLQLITTPQRWFARLLEVPHIRLVDLSPEVLIAASFLPGKPPRDPADRIIVATARDLGATVVTRDRALLDYGAQGYISTVAC